MTNAADSVPLHQWVHDGEDVLFVRCCDQEGKSYEDFQWPDEVGAIVEPVDWQDNHKCGHGLHGWPWGIGIGIGKEPQYTGKWYVLAVKPEDVKEIEFGKYKFKQCKIVYVGDIGGVMNFTQAGRQAWVDQNTQGSVSQMGCYGSASQTGDIGSASQNGDYGSASQTGYRGSASQNGDYGSASQKGDYGSASQVGNYGSASQKGKLGIASICGEEGTIQVDVTGLGAVAGSKFTWKVVEGAVVVQRWLDKDGNASETFLRSKELGLKTGDVVEVEQGKIIQRNQNAKLNQKTED